LVQTIVIAPTLAARAGLRAILQAEEHVEVIAEAVSFAGLPELDTAVDVFVAMTSAEDLGSWGRAAVPDEPPPAVLLLTDSGQEGGVLVSLPLRAWGLLPTDCTEEELVTALYTLDLGMVAGSPAQIQPLLSEPGAKANPEGDPPVNLTSRELEVLSLLADGLANKQISLALEISEHTVKFHVSSIYSKLNVSNRAEAVRMGIQLGLIMV
jgi:DNA-binding NarL/FixJ family response regulator